MRQKALEKLGVNTRLKGTLLFLFTLFSFVSLISYNFLDNSFNVVSDAKITNWCGKLGAIFADIIMQCFGYAFYIAIPFLLYLSVKLITRKPPRFIKFKICYAILTTISCSLLLGFLAKYKTFQILPGGCFGYWIYQKVELLAIKLIAVWCSTLIIILYPYACFKFGKKLPKQLRQEGKTHSIAMTLFKIMHITKIVVGKILFILCLPIRLLRKNKVIRAKKQQKIDEKNIRKNVAKQEVAKTREVDYYFPSVSLLHPMEQKNTAQSNMVCKENMNKLEKILGEFGVRGEMVAFKSGPIVTLYEFKPNAGVKASRVIGLCDDIARTMMVSSVRISTIQGRDTLGIEVPNQERSIVCFRDLVESQEYQMSTASVPMILGCNIFGQPVIADLTTMPHLLVAGTTGSGKSVGINGMILSMLYKLSPEDCRLIMIDPKMLEFSSYQGIQNLLLPVITDAKDAVLALKWAVKEMENRYRLMSEYGVRNITGYNQKVKDNNEKGEMVRMEKMPYIVVIIDEMADLMVVAGKEIEVLVQRLSQMARAAGIHLIMATQRPSVDVITGVIKANFPTRISYAVSSKIDSRTILGEQGAEQLLGKGDMLLSIGGGKTKRVHGPFISDKEVEDVVSYLKKHNGEPDYITLINEDEEGGNFDGEFEGGGDDMYRQAVQIVVNDKKSSISYLQRKLRIGYNKAANFIEQMEEDGILSSPDSTGKRMILKKE